MGQAIKRVKLLPSLPVGGTVRVVKGRPTVTTGLIKVTTVISQGVIIVIIIVIIVVVVIIIIFTVTISIVHLATHCVWRSPRSHFPLFCNDRLLLQGRFISHVYAFGFEVSPLSLCFCGVPWLGCSAMTLPALLGGSVLHKSSPLHSGS